jgi:hypothetical protein
MHTALFSLIEDAQKYETMAQRAEESLDRHLEGSLDDELTQFLREIACRSREQAEVAKRLLAQRVAE